MEQLQASRARLVGLLAEVADTAAHTDSGLTPPGPDPCRPGSAPWWLRTPPNRRPRLGFGRVVVRSRPILPTGVVTSQETAHDLPPPSPRRPPMRTSLAALAVFTGVAAGVLAPTPAGAAPVASASVTESTEALAALARPCRLDRGWWEHARAILGLDC